MIFILKNLINQYNSIIKNSFYLSIVYGIKLLLPFIAMPYIIRVCGAENYGKIILAQTIAIYFVAFVNLGLLTVIPKEVVDNIESSNKLSEIVSSVMVIRFTLCIIGTIILFPIVCSITNLRNLHVLILFSYITVLAEIPSMYSIFQGLEKIKYITWANTFSSILYVVGLITFVKNETMYIFVPLLQSASILFSNSSSLIILCKKYNIKIVAPSVSYINSLIKKSFHFTIANLSITINANLARILSGITLGVNDLAYLDIAQKISETAATPTSIVEQALFPHNARKKDYVMARQMFWIMFVFSCICAALLLIGTPVAVRFFGAGKLNAAIPLCYWLSIKVVLTGLNYYTGAPLLVAFGYPKPYNSSIIASTVIILFLSLVFYIFNCFSLPLFIFLIIFGDFITLVIRLYHCKKYINIP